MKPPARITVRVSLFSPAIDSKLSASFGNTKKGDVRIKKMFSNKGNKLDLNNNMLHPPRLSMNNKKPVLDPKEIETKEGIDNVKSNN